MKITQKELTALKAVYYLAERNPRLKYGGVWIEDAHNMKTCQMISFMEAMCIVEKIIYGNESENKETNQCSES